VTTTEIPTVSVRELKQKLDARENFQLIDVREPLEYEMANIDSAKLIPLGELPKRMNELDRERLTIVHCHSGQRSAQAVRLLQEAGFANVFNLEGGIAKWSDEVDSDVPQY
jgi:adenylyltransferase/sulfurtransferase